MPPMTSRTPPLGPEALRKTARAREEFISAPDEFLGSAHAAWVRPEILSSWRRSWSSGVDSYRTDVAHAEGLAGSSRLVRVARPVLDRLADRLAGLPTCVYLTDRHAHILQRAVDDRSFAAELDHFDVAPGTTLSEDTAGTNGLGTVVEQHGPVLVAGAEHYREEYQRYTCAGVPLRDPITNRLEGVIDITCRYEDTNGLLLPLVTEAARAIEEEFLGEFSAGERALFEEFIKAKHRFGSQAVISLNEDTFVTNAVAAQLLEASDQDLIWARAHDAARAGREITMDVQLSRDVPATARLFPVQHGTRTAGVIGVITPRPVKQRWTAETESPSVAITRSPAWKRVMDRVAYIADSDMSVLFRGEPGTGKSFVARLLHERNPSCGELSEFDCLLALSDPQQWLTELRSVSAKPGTTVLRHIDELPVELAGAVGGLLDFGGNRRRFLATAGFGPMQHRALTRLLERLVFTVDLPPLRERTEDIPNLVRDLVAQLRTPPYPRFTQAAVRALMHSDWPGNVSQLRQVVAAATVSALSADVTPHDLPENFRSEGERRQPVGLERVERETIAAALRNARWNREQAAKQLDISRTTLWRKMKKFGMSEPPLRGNSSGGTL